MLRPATASRAAAALLAGGACALLVACGSTGDQLIPLSAAGPLQSDFEAVSTAAQGADGNCAPTEAALEKTERDFAHLPATIAPALRDRLEEGIRNLRTQAMSLCSQPGPTSTTKTSETHTTTTPPASTTTTPAEENGGVPSHEQGEQKEPESGTGGSAPEAEKQKGGGSANGGLEPQ